MGEGGGEGGGGGGYASSYMMVNIIPEWIETDGDRVPRDSIYSGVGHERKDLSRAAAWGQENKQMGLRFQRKRGCPLD